MDTRRGCRSNRSPTPWKNKNIFFRCIGGLFATFFSIGEGFMLRFLFYEGFFSLYGGLFATFFLREGLFCYVFLLVWGLFHNVGAFFAIFSPCGETFLSLWGILCLYAFFMGLPLPSMIYFAGACYYVTFTPCPPPSLTAAIMYPTKPTATPVFNSQ